LKKEKLAGILGLVVIVVSMLGVQQGYARTGAPPGQGSHTWVLVAGVSNPSGSCLNLNLSGGHGTVTILPNSRVGIFLQNASPDSTYTVSVGYVQANGGCDGTWKTVGSLKTDSAGYGTLTAHLNLASGHNYVFEFHDNAGNVAYATDTLSL
jgi:hypothetical protein